MRPLLCRFERGGLVAGVVGCLAVSAFALQQAFRRTYSLQLWPDAVYLGLLAGLFLSLIASVAVGAWLVLAWMRGAFPVSSLAPYRAVFLLLFLSVVFYLAFLQPFKMLHLVLYEGMVAGTLSVGALFSMILAPRRWFARLERVALAICLTLLALELGLRLLSRISGSPLLVRSTSVEDTLRVHRFEPGEIFCGQPCNSLGFNDVEPTRSEGGALALLIGDSFVVGVVPRPLHLSSVAEEVLGGLEISCLGVNGAGPGEYLTMLRREGMPLGPDLAFVSLFVGNDVTDALRFRPDHVLLRSLLDRDRMATAQVTTRLLALLREGRRGAPGGEVGRVQGELTLASVELSLDEMLSSCPWLEDPALEKPTFSLESFLEVERYRSVTACNPQDTLGYHKTFESLLEMRQVAGSVPLLVVLIPDEFQVEDDLWNTLEERGPPVTLDPDLPQRLLGEWLTEKGIPFLDLLPVLRAVPPGPDGRRHVYHLQDTHLNARGNRVAGEALAEWLREWVERG